MIEKNKKTLIIGHAGASKLAPGNTLTSFQKAIDLGADYVEFDVHISKDGEIVIMHDPNTFSTTGHKGLIKSMPLKELKMLKIGDGERIPTLQELIEIAKDKIGLQIEVKARRMAEKLVSILKREELIESSIVSSFLHGELLKIQKIEPKIKLATLEPIVYPLRDSWEYRKGLIKNIIDHNFYAIHPREDIVNKRLIEYAHENNIKVHAWTVNDVNKMRSFINLRIDGIITDDIEAAKNALNRNN